MSCKIVPHKPLDGRFAKCALRNVVGKRGRKNIEDVGKTPKGLLVRQQGLPKKNHGCYNY
jgi:hypothetical protein